MSQTLAYYSLDRLVRAILIVNAKRNPLASANASRRTVTSAVQAQRPDRRMPENNFPRFGMRPTRFRRALLQI
jgi:hypothetical protein